MGAVESVTRLSDDRLKWKAHIRGVCREWEARILEQVPNYKVAWASHRGHEQRQDHHGPYAGIQPEGVVEKVGELLHIVGRQAEHDLKKFKKFIERVVPAGTARPVGTGQAGDGMTRPEHTRCGHVFDQTNGLVDFEGESDETA